MYCFPNFFHYHLPLFKKRGIFFLIGVVQLHTNSTKLKRERERGNEMGMETCFVVVETTWSGAFYICSSLRCSALKM